MLKQVSSQKKFKNCRDILDTSYNKAMQDTSRCLISRGDIKFLKKVS